MKITLKNYTVIRLSRVSKGRLVLHSSQREITQKTVTKKRAKIFINLTLQTVVLRLRMITDESLWRKVEFILLQIESEI